MNAQGDYAEFAAAEARQHAANAAAKAEAAAAAANAARGRLIRWVCHPDTTGCPMLLLTCG